MTKQSPDPDAAGKLTAKEDVRRIVQRLAALSTPQDLSHRGASGTGRVPFGDFAGLVDWLVEQRRSRIRHFPVELASGPGWDIILQLLQAQVEGRQLYPSNLSLELPATTVARWIDALEQWGLAIRRRNVPAPEAIELTPAAERALLAYLRDLCGGS